MLPEFEPVSARSVLEPAVAFSAPELVRLPLSIRAPLARLSAPSSISVPWSMVALSRLSTAAAAPPLTAASTVMVPEVLSRLEPR